MNSDQTPNPIDELLRARLRITEGAERRIKALRIGMSAYDAISRRLTGYSFFALREGEEVLRTLDDRVGADLVETLLGMNGGTEIVAHGLDNIPEHGPVVIGATHPVGTFDFIAHAGAMLARRPDLKVVSNREAERFLGPERIVAVDLDRSDRVLTARQTLEGMQDHLTQGGALLVFGSGRVANKARGLLVEPPWRSGITRISAKTDAPVIPASADLQNSKHYYRTRRFAQFVTGGNEYLGREIASLRYSSELIAKLGGRYEVHYGNKLAPGTPPADIKAAAERLVPGLYRPA